MSKNLRYVLAAGVVIVVIAVAVFAYATRPLEAPSEDIQENTERLEAGDDASGEQIVYSIDQGASRVEFFIDEVLGGRDNTVNGVTNQVAGDILINFADPAASDVGEIRINARTFQTDNSRRDGAIGRFILRAEDDEFEFITFAPTSISGLPESAAIGDTVDLSITGNLSIAGTTREVTFNGQVTLSSEDQISGTAETTVMYPDFSLTIPPVPSVASVDEDVILRLTFVANRSTGAEAEATESA